MMTARALTHLLGAACLLAPLAYTAQVPTQTPPDNAIWHGRHSEAIEPFRIISNIYYVGARNIASYLITTPEGHIMIDTGTKEMHDVLRTNIAKLGFKLRDIKIILEGHTHFDHVQDHEEGDRRKGHGNA
jgi:metallo-beta-lactamase class B